GLEAHFITVILPTVMPKVSSKGKSPSARLFLTPKTTTGTNPPNYNPEASEGFQRASKSLKPA
ncbi:hypothetical protein LD690_24435, partial [Salmonella enterica]|nr:hypothetical protein [Salmonella enterica]